MTRKKGNAGPPGNRSGPSGTTLERITSAVRHHLTGGPRHSLRADTTPRNRDVKPEESAFWITFFRPVAISQNPHEFSLSGFSPTRFTTQGVLRNCGSKTARRGLTVDIRLMGRPAKEDAFRT